MKGTDFGASYSEGWPGANHVAPGVRSSDGTMRQADESTFTPHWQPGPPAPARDVGAVDGRPARLAVSGVADGRHEHPYAQLTMPGTSRWDLANVLAVFAMWVIMMAAMMLPSALPMILTFVDLSGRTSDFARGQGFVLAYLLVWLAFSALATMAQWALQALDWVDPMIVSTSAWLTGALLLIAGLYQFSPLKRICLSGCRSPMAFLIGDWRPGFRGAFVMGARHGLLCLGCCWALMGLLFVGGVMNLAWLAAVSVVVAVEKVLPGGDRFARLMGMVLIGLGCTKLITAVGYGP